MNIEATCNTCQNSFTAREADLKRGYAKYCSKSCFGKRPTKKYVVHDLNTECAYCKKQFYLRPSQLKKSKSGLYFCCREHKDKAQRLENNLPILQPGHYGNGNHSRTYRGLAFRNFPAKCNRCGYDKYVGVLQVHHKDRDRTNNTLDNLEILCPNCHHEDHFHAHDGLFSAPSWT